MAGAGENYKELLATSIPPGPIYPIYKGTGQAQVALQFPFAQEETILQAVVPAPGFVSLQTAAFHTF